MTHALVAAARSSSAATIRSPLRRLRSGRFLQRYCEPSRNTRRGNSSGSSSRAWEGRSSQPTFRAIRSLPSEARCIGGSGRGGTSTALAANKATRTIPIVTAAGDLVEMGLAASLARPGGNVTGLTTSGRELIGKRIELLKETLPRLARIAVLWYPESRTQPLQLKDAEAAAKSLRLQVRRAEARGPEDLEKVFATIVHERPEALVLFASYMFQAHRLRIVELAARYRLPATFADRSFVEAGGLMSYGPDRKAISRQLASYVDRILKGAKPGDLPIEQPTKFELVINLKTAKALGLTIPPSLLARADEVVQ